VDAKDQSEAVVVDPVLEVDVETHLNEGYDAAEDVEEGHLHLQVDELDREVHQEVLIVGVEHGAGE
jgi:hypothetical protein